MSKDTPASPLWYDVTKTSPRVPCPSCGCAVTGLGNRVRIEAKKTSPPVVLSSLLDSPDVYLLEPCGCRVSTDWAAAFSLEMKKRAENRPSSAVCITEQTYSESVTYYSDTLQKLKVLRQHDTFKTEDVDWWVAVITEAYSLLRRDAGFEKDGVVSMSGKPLYQQKNGTLGYLPDHAGQLPSYKVAESPVGDAVGCFANAHKTKKPNVPQVPKEFYAELSEGYGNSMPRELVKQIYDAIPVLAVQALNAVERLYSKGNVTYACTKLHAAKLDIMMQLDYGSTLNTDTVAFIRKFIEEAEWDKVLPPALALSIYAAYKNDTSPLVVAEPVSVPPPVQQVIERRDGKVRRKIRKLRSDVDE